MDAAEPPEVSAIFAGYEPNGATVDEGGEEDLSWLHDDGVASAAVNTVAVPTADIAGSASADNNVNVPSREPRDESGSPSRNAASGAGTLSISDL